VPDVPCRAFRASTDEQLDGTSDALRSTRSAPHLRRCPACLAWVTARHAYRRMMQRLGEAVVAPLELRDRIRAVLHRDAERPNA
jgi:predicted anti-sigma-YlaC factor YlaD